MRYRHSSYYFVTISICFMFIFAGGAAAGVNLLQKESIGSTMTSISLDMDQKTISDVVVRSSDNLLQVNIKKGTIVKNSSYSDEVRILVTEPWLLPKDVPGLVNGKKVVYDMKPHSVVFDTPVSISFYYNADTSAAEVPAIFVFDNDTWQEIDSYYDTNSKRVHAQYNRLTLVGVYTREREIVYESQVDDMTDQWSSWYYDESIENQFQKNILNWKDDAVLFLWDFATRIWENTMFLISPSPI